MDKASDTIPNKKDTKSNFELINQFQHNFYGCAQKLKEIEEIQYAIKAEQKNEPTGHLMISLMVKKRKPRYFCVSFYNRKRIIHGIGKNKKLVYKLAHKAYLENLQDRIEHNKLIYEHAAEKELSVDPADILNSLPRNFSLLDASLIINPDKLELAKGRPNPVSYNDIAPVVLKTSFDDLILQYLNISVIKSDYEMNISRKNKDNMSVENKNRPLNINKNAYTLNAENQNESVAYIDDFKQYVKINWKCIPYCENTSHVEFKTNIAGNGLYARSKSEVSIISIYDYKAIAFHYDEAVYLEYESLDGYLVKEKISPDFIGIRSDGRVIVHEHVGLINDEEYVNRLYKKLDKYKKAGFVQGKNLLLTFDDENGNINLELVNKLIDDIYKIQD